MTTHSSVPEGVDVEQVTWRLAVDAAQVGAFDWDLREDALRWDERLLRVFGVRREEWGGTIQAFNDLVHPDDLPRVSRALEQAVETCGEYAAEYRVRTPDGDQRWVAARGRALPGPDGLAVRVVGAAYDTTAQHRSEARVARVLESMPTAFFQLDRDWRFSYLNSEAVALLGAVDTDLVGADIWEAFPAAVGTEFEHYYRGAVASGEPVSFDAYYPAPLDAWYEVRAWPSPDGLAVYFIDVTVRHRAQEQVARAAARGRLLDAVTHQLGQTLDQQEAIRRLGPLLVPEMADWAAVTLVDERATESRFAVLRDVGSWSRAGSVARGPRAVGPLEAATRFADADSLAALTGSGVVLASPAVEGAAAVLAPDLPVDLPVGAGVAVLPLRGRDRLVGLVTVARAAGSFDDDERQTFSDLAVRAGLALDNARLFAEQRDLAEGLQRRLLTDPPDLPGLQVAVRYAAAAEAAQVGGDWYDAFVQDDGRAVVVVGDVVGHDAAAAAAMSQVRSLLRGVAAYSGDGPADVLTGVDRVLRSLGVEITATALVARLGTADDGRTTVRWSSAGHPPPVLVAADGTARLLVHDVPDLLLGLDADTAREERSLELEPGSVLLLYTDGLVERRGEDLDRGLERLCARLEAVMADASPGVAGPGQDLQLLCDELLEQMVPGHREDDVALVAVRAAESGDETGAPDPATMLTKVLPAHPTSVSAARRLVGQAVDDAGTEVAGAPAGELRDAALLAVSELVTNALVHAGTAVTVAVHADTHGLRVAVRDGSAHSPVPRRHALTSATGRGLRLVDASVDRWGVDRHHDGKSVWFELGVTRGRTEPGDEGPVDPPPTPVRVVLRDVPLLMHWAWQEHAAALLREHLLTTLDEAGAMERHAAASDALDLLREQVPAPATAEEGPDAVLASATDPAHLAAEVLLEVPARSVPHFEVLDLAVVEAGREAASGRLLGPPSQPEIVALWRWLCGEVLGQAAGAAPVPFDMHVGHRRPAGSAAEATYAGLLEGRGAALVADSSASVVVAATEGAARMLGYAHPADLVGRSVLAVVPERFHQAHVAGTTLHAATGRDVLLDVTLTVPVLRADGSEVEMSLLVEPVRLEEETVFVAGFGPA